MGETPVLTRNSGKYSTDESTHPIDLKYLAQTINMESIRYSSRLRRPRDVLISPHPPRPEPTYSPATKDQQREFTSHIPSDIAKLTWI